MVDILGNLSRESIINSARNLFSGFIDRGLSANKSLKELQSLGLGYNRADFLRDFKVAKENYDISTKIRYVNLDKTPSEGILQERYTGVPDRFSFVFKATGTDNQTGEATDRYFFYHRNTLDTRDNMESEALSWYSMNMEKYQFTSTSIRIVEGYKNPAWV